MRTVGPGPSSPRTTLSSARHRDDSPHNWNEAGWGIGCPMCSRITDQRQETKQCTNWLSTTERGRSMHVELYSLD